MHRVADLVIGKRCPICLSGVDLRSAAVVVPCSHAYCIWCIRRWSDFKRRCPLCNADFSSWLCKIGKDFCEVKLLPIGGSQPVGSFPRDDASLRRLRAQFFEQRRVIRRAKETTLEQSRTKALPRQRSFEQSSHESPDVAERIKQWRASIYEKRFQAVPFSSKNGMIQKSSEHIGAQEMILRKIKQWIQRELQAILGDPDPTIIVHVATSLFISIHKKKQENIPGQVFVGDDYLAPLRPFLGEQTELFWHELRCFAESSFTMETYDTVVVYKAID